MEEDEDVLSSNNRADTVPVGRVVESGSYFTPKHTDQLNSIICSCPDQPVPSGGPRWTAVAWDGSKGDVYLSVTPC